MHISAVLTSVYLGKGQERNGAARIYFRRVQVSGLSFISKRRLLFRPFSAMNYRREWRVRPQGWPKRYSAGKLHVRSVKLAYVGRRWIIVTVYSKTFTTWPFYITFLVKRVARLKFNRHDQLCYPKNVKYIFLNLLCWHKTAYVIFTFS